ncbi:MAG: M23 family metallopeptidase [bacterium]|nr:M23 family metallopeptidase [bacterium]
MRQFASIFVLAVSFFFSQEVFAALSINAPKFVKQGGVIRVAIKTDGSYNHCEVAFRGVVYNAVQENVSGYLAILPVSVTSEPGTAYAMIICNNDRNVLDNIILEIKIEKVDFPVARGVRFVGEMKGKLLARFKSEKAELEKLFALITLQRYWQEDLRFSFPLKDMQITSPFGQIRHKVSNRYGKWDINHFGADLRADIGTPVFAAEDGIVRVAGNFLAEGNMVLIDHGYGLVSLYFHLSKLKVKKGDVVQKGDKIALSGQTAAREPHLHFEIRLYGVAVNPWEFMPEPPEAKSRGEK